MPHDQLVGLTRNETQIALDRLPAVGCGPIAPGAGFFPVAEIHQVGIDDTLQQAQGLA